MRRTKFDKIQKDFDLCWKFGSKMRFLTIPDLRRMKFVRGGGGGTPISNGYRCKARTSIWWEHNLKKWGGIGWECYFWYFSERFKSRNLKKKLSKMAKMINLSVKLKQNVASCGSRMQKIGGLWVRAIEKPTFHQEMWGLLVTAETISKNMGHWVTAALKIGSLWSLTSASPP